MIPPFVPQPEAGATAGRVLRCGGRRARGDEAGTRRRYGRARDGGARGAGARRRERRMRHREAAREIARKTRGTRVVVVFAGEQRAKEGSLARRSGRPGRRPSRSGRPRRDPPRRWRGGGARSRSRGGRRRDKRATATRRDRAAAAAAISNGPSLGRRGSGPIQQQIERVAEELRHLAARDAVVRAVVPREAPRDDVLDVEKVDVLAEGVGRRDVGEERMRRARGVAGIREVRDRDRCRSAERRRLRPAPRSPWRRRSPSARG